MAKPFTPEHVRDPLNKTELEERIHRLCAGRLGP